MKKYLLNVSLLMVAILVFSACSEDDSPQIEEVSENLVEIAQGNEDFSTLVTALTEADLASTLSGTGPFTVFAPTNSAFATLLEESGLTVDELLQSELLSDVLLYHVVAGKVLSTDLTNGSVETLSGESIDTSVDGGVTINGNITVTTANVEGTNGVIHIIDGVLVPENLILNPSIVDIASGDENFSILVQALVTSELTDALSGDGPFTVFAPTNAAFEALLVELDITAEELLAMEDLANILLYHVVSGRIYSTDLSNGDVPTLLTDQEVSISIVDGVIINDVANVTTADIKAKNGVIHVIDYVLVPSN